MNKILTGIFVSAAGLTFSAAAIAATPVAKATYDAAEDTATSTYKISRAKCDSVTGVPKDVCIEEAKAALVRTQADANAVYKGTLKASTDARKEIADADYSVAKAKCGAKTGNAKDVCVKEAKATQIAATADAKADKKVIEARVDARDDKLDAEYKVAKEKCDALAGAPKDTCVASAKAQFGK